MISYRRNDGQNPVSSQQPTLINQHMDATHHKLTRGISNSPTRGSNEQLTPPASVFLLVVIRNIIQGWPTKLCRGRPLLTAKRTPALLHQIFFADTQDIKRSKRNETRLCWTEMEEVRHGGGSRYTTAKHKRITYSLRTNVHVH